MYKIIRMENESALAAEVSKYLEAGYMLLPLVMDKGNYVQTLVKYPEKKLPDDIQGLVDRYSGKDFNDHMSLSMRDCVTLAKFLNFEEDS